MSSSPCYIIAEAGVNHNGSEDLALLMVDVASCAGADAIKFQSFSTENLVSRSARKALYQEKATGGGSQYEMLKSLELRSDAYERIARYCNDKKIDFISTPFDEESVDFLVDIRCKFLKVSSGDLTNDPLLEYMASKDIPMILSTGMSYLHEVEHAVSVISDVRRSHGFCRPLSEVLTILHCTSSYPAKLSDVNLRAMQTLQDVFDLPVGYSDHTIGTQVAPVARAMGASVYEKHFTLSRGLEGPDHAASLEPNELLEMVHKIREVDLILGSREKRPSESEMDVRRIARRSIAMACDADEGSVISREMISLMRPGEGLSPSRLKDILGKRLRRAVRKGDILHEEDIV